MGTTGKRVGCAALVALATAGPGCDSPKPAPDPTVTINGRTWHVELATTIDTRYKGLSDRPHLDRDGGMLFIYPAPDILDFCMRDCLIPLDIAFINSDLKVVETYTMPVEPYGFDQASYSSMAPAQYALELNAGALAAAGVRVGDKVEFSADVPPAAKAEPGP